MYSLPSASHSREPSARSTKKGSPPTPRNARTGEFTPPGVTSQARRKSVRLFALRSAAGRLAALLPCAALSELVILSSKRKFPMTKRFWALLLAGLLAGGTAACNDNAEDHTEEAAEEARSGDMEEAAEESAEARQDSAQGDLTEGPN